MTPFHPLRLVSARYRMDRSRPNCDIGHTRPGRPLPDLTADPWSLNVPAKEVGRP
jgi:hypothetical protein